MHMWIIFQNSVHRGLPTRILASTWWFFCIIVVSSYTANLAAFLTVETPVKLIKNVEDLANQNVIKYGAKRDGATFNFFRVKQFLFIYFFLQLFVCI